jgi:hypothetical protein
MDYTKRKRGWAWCFKCEMLFFVDTEWLSYCPAGGAHDESFAASFMYAINTEHTGENGWRRCTRCQCLYKNDSGLAMLKPGCCPAPQGGSVFDKLHASDDAVPFFIEKNLPSDTALQTGWRRCCKCLALFFSGHASPGKCSKGGNHDATDSANYGIFVE